MQCSVSIVIVHYRTYILLRQALGNILSVFKNSFLEMKARSSGEKQRPSVNPAFVLDDLRGQRLAAAGSHSSHDDEAWDHDECDNEAGKDDHLYRLTCHGDLSNLVCGISIIAPDEGESKKSSLVIYRHITLFDNTKILLLWIY